MEKIQDENVIHYRLLLVAMLNFLPTQMDKFLIWCKNFEIKNGQ
jgi:hypothetical protein